MELRLQRFEKTNEMLTNCNALSASRLKMVGPEFKKHTQTLIEMKKDMDYIFKKIRAIKTKLANQYPTQFAEALRNSLAEECEEDVTGREESKGDTDECISYKSDARSVINAVNDNVQSNIDLESLDLSDKSCT